MRCSRLLVLAAAVLGALAVPAGALAFDAQNWIEPEGPGSGTVAQLTSHDGVTVDCGWDGQAQSGSCYAIFQFATTRTLTATADPGSVFDRWVGGCPEVISGPEANVCTYTVDDEDDDYTLRPRFELAPLGPPPLGTTLSVLLGGAGFGTVTSLDGGIDCGADCDEIYPDGTSVTLSANPALGSGFTGWGGACAGSFAPDCTVVVSGGGTVEVTATFVGTGLPACDISGSGVIRGTAASEVICGSFGDDTIFGGGGDDTIYAFEGNDTVHGGTGRDVVFGSYGQDRLYGDAGRDELRGGAGADRLYGGPAADALYGGSGRDTASGGSGADTCAGCETRVSCP